MLIEKLVTKWERKLISISNPLKAIEINSLEGGNLSVLFQGKRKEVTETITTGTLEITTPFTDATDILKVN